jgi:hypothetical protein
VLDLREVDVGIAVVDERVEEVERLPNGQRLAVERKVSRFFSSANPSV